MTDGQSLTVGQKLGPQTYRVTRAELIRYAGAASDFNPIHWSDRQARAVGLPGVIAHGMLTMALAGRAVTTWIADPGAIVEYGVRFTKPIVVPDDDDGAEVTVTGTVRSIEGTIAQVDLHVSSGGDRVLAQARARVRLIPPAAPDHD